MIKVCTLGFGNCGNQISDLAMSMYKIPGIAINSSQNDLINIKNVTKVILGDQRGSGKSRDEAKKFVKMHVRALLEQEMFVKLIEDSDIIFIISSIGGGTGSGMVPMVTDVLSRKFPSKKFILIGVYPPIGESLAAQQNSLDYLKEVQSFLPNVSYMAYDNNKFSNLPTPEMMKKINTEIVEAMVVLRGDYFYATPYNSIDEKDLMNIVDAPGRLAVYILDNIKEKDFDNTTIEESIIDVIKNKSGGVELDRDKIVKKIGYVTNLNSKMNSMIDPDYSKIKELVGEPVEAFEHTYIAEKDEANRFILILSGLSVPDDRLTKMVQRIETGLEELANVKESSVLGSLETSRIKELRSQTMKTSSDFDIDELFGKYDS